LLAIGNDEPEPSFDRLVERSIDEPQKFNSQKSENRKNPKFKIAKIEIRNSKIGKICKMEN